MSALSALGDGAVVAKRNLIKIKRVPDLLVFTTLQPIMFVLLFVYVFGGVIDVPGGNYTEYLIGGILVQTIAFGMMGPGVSVANDLGEGIVDRIRSLPTSRSAYLVGHFIAEFAAATLGVAVLAATGFAVGWSIDSSVLDAAAGVGLLLLFAAAMICLGTLIGVIAPSGTP